MLTGIVFNIQKCSIHDGPGIRTLVFLKGCPLRCLWCSNPESQNPNPQVISFNTRCIGCGECKAVCPQGAIYIENDIFKINSDLCNDCGLCAQVCYANSKQIMGKQMSVNEVFDEILKDKRFYEKSGGGVTFSGGESLMQSDFLLEILKECKKMNINTALETCGYSDFESFKEVAKYLDLIYFDIKHLDSDIHKKITGVSNDIILENLKKLDDERKDLIIRIPVIPGYNDSEKHIKSIGEFCIGLKSIKKLELLPYHKLGEYKYASINKEYKLEGLESPSEEHMIRLKNIINDVIGENGLICEVVHS